MENDSSALDNFDQPTNKITIPRIFHSDLLGAPMDHCIACEKKLLEGNTPYMIEKSLKIMNGFKSYSTLFEYAICMQCAQDMNGAISDLSRKKMMQYFGNNFQHQPRQDLLKNAVTNERDWIDRCVLKGKYVEELTECQIYGYCEGDQLIFGEFPYMISGNALDEIVGLLSPETLNDLKDIKDIFDKPSEFQDLLKSGPKVFI